MRGTFFHPRKKLALLDALATLTCGFLVIGVAWAHPKLLAVG
jgi:hypothetical protein